MSKDVESSSCVSSLGDGSALLSEVVKAYDTPPSQEQDMVPESGGERSNMLRRVRYRVG